MLALAGCSLIHKVTDPKATITAPSGAVLTQTGAAQVPAKIDTDTTKTTVPIPAGTEIIVDRSQLPGVQWQDGKVSGPLTLRLARDTVLTSETRSEHATAPQAFTPPAPPTPGQLADAKASGWFWAGLVAGGAVALFGLVRGWDFVMYGGAAVSGGCALGLFFQKHPLLFTLIGVGVALAVAGPYFWHMHLKHLEPEKK